MIEKTKGDEGIKLTFNFCFKKRAFIVDENMWIHVMKTITKIYSLKQCKIRETRERKREREREIEKEK